MASSDDKRLLGGLILGLFVTVTMVMVYFIQKDMVIKYEGAFAMVKPMIRGDFVFSEKGVEILLSETPLAGRMVVFAYDEKGDQVAILKPVYNGRVTLGPGEFADYRVRFANGAVKGFEIIQKLDGVRDGEDFLHLLTRARDAAWRYGVQECLYPVCTICMDVCPVIAYGVIKMVVAEDGRINPVYSRQNCPRSGRCFEACKLGVIVRDAAPPDTLIGAMATVPGSDAAPKKVEKKTGKTEKSLNMKVKAWDDLAF